jgi:hypothetical protein
LICIPLYPSVFLFITPLSCYFPLFLSVLFISLFKQGSSLSLSAPHILISRPKTHWLSVSLNPRTRTHTHTHYLFLLTHTAPIQQHELSWKLSSSMFSFTTNRHILRGVQQFAIGTHSIVL